MVLPEGPCKKVQKKYPFEFGYHDKNRQDLSGVLSLNLQERLTSTNSSHRGIPVRQSLTCDCHSILAAFCVRMERDATRFIAFIPAGTLPATVLKDFKSRLKASGFQLPQGYELKYKGASGEQETCDRQPVGLCCHPRYRFVATLILSTNLRLAFLVCLIALTSVGFSLIALWLSELPLGFMAIIGIIGMKGVAVNDACASSQRSKQTRELV